MKFKSAVRSLPRISDGLRQELQARIPTYGVTIFIVWPVCSAIMAAAELKRVPYFSVSSATALLGSFAGMLALTQDFLVVSTVAMAASLLVFAALASRKHLRSQHIRLGLGFEPVLLYMAALFGSSLQYPELLSHQMLSPFYLLPVWIVTILLYVPIVAGTTLLAVAGSRLRVLGIVTTVGLLMPLPVALGAFRTVTPPPQNSIVLLGLDSLSHNDNLELLQDWTKHQGGTWYTRAVPPGLLTNSVWVSLLTMRPVREHGVFHTFQSFPRSPGQEHLVEKARRQGYRTISVFPDQLTCWVGTEAGFDEDLSGPLGWRQLVTRYVENASLLLPLVRPLLPKLPFSTIPSNHAGTFTYDIQRELDQIFSLGNPKTQTFVAAHTTYLHLPRFPGYVELSWAELRRVLVTPAILIRDRSFNWQDVDLPIDPIPLREWKVRRLQQAIIRSIERTQFLSSDRLAGRLLLFSDHGHRAELTADNFTEERYHHVLLATFGLPVRDPDVPISLLEIGSLLGINSRAGPHEPIVEFTLSRPNEWPELLKSAQLGCNGSVVLDSRSLATVFTRLRAFRPWSARPALSGRSDDPSKYYKEK